MSRALGGKAEIAEEELAAAARSGDRAALEQLVARIQGRVYNLAVRMVWHPADAEDAAQEILIKIVTHLADFRGDSRFSTWTWRVATNHLLTTRKRSAERRAVGFDDFARDLDEGLSDTVVSSDIDERLLLEEVKVGCMQGMLLCLDRQQRAAYIVGEIFEMSDREAAEVFEIRPAAYRKRLSRARAAVRAFMQGHCGLVDPGNPCRCRRQLASAISRRRVDPRNRHFADSGEDEQVLRGIAEMDKLERAAALFRSHPTYQPRREFRRAIAELLDSGRVTLLRRP